jgi:hypothetical protein
MVVYFFLEQSLLCMVIGLKLRNSDVDDCIEEKGRFAKRWHLEAWNWCFGAKVF